MAIKVYKSTHTWRTIEYQDSMVASIIGQGASVYVGDDELQTILRPTRRQTKDVLCMASIAVLAKEESKFKGLVRDIGKRNIIIKSIEENFELDAKSKGKKLLELWKGARTKGAAKVGGTISANLRKANSAEAVAKIKDRWPLPSKEWPTGVLLEEAGISLNTAKTLLGKRPIAQYNYQAKLKRKARTKHAL